MEAAAEASAAKQKYVASSQELASAISSLENALVAFVGREEGIKVLPRLLPLTTVLVKRSVLAPCAQGQVFAQTRARLEEELAASRGSSDATR